MLRNWFTSALATIIVLGIFAAETRAATGQIVLRVTPLGPMPTDLNTLSITPDGQHVAVEGNAGSRLKVFIDGNEGDAYGSIVQMPSLGQGAAPRLLMISPDQTRYAYVATKRPGETVMVVNQKESPVYESIYGAIFSPVGHRLAYIVMKGNKKFVVVDSTASPAYQQLSEGGFSDDGKHFSYMIMSDEKVATWHVVVDGKVGPGYSNVSKLKMGPTGRFAYVANIGSSLTPLERQAHANDTQLGDHMVVDGQLGPRYDLFQPAVFSADGNHVAYIATSGRLRQRKSVAVIDGQPGPEFDQVSNVLFSPDGKHVAYTATNAHVGVPYAGYAIVDGQKSIDYAGVGSYVYSPDSQHLAYEATSSNHKSIIVLDGKEGDPYDATILTPTAFSPDSKRFAYIASVAHGKMSLVLDGKAGPPLPSIDPRSLQFTPDSQHCRFKVGMSADASFYVMDDQTVDSAGSALDLAATVDGRHTAIVAAKDVGTGVQTCRVSLDGKPIGETYQGVQSLQISADGAHVAGIAFSQSDDKKNAHAVFDGHEGPGYFRIDKLLLSPDGQHIAYACTEDGSKHYVVVDSFQGPEYNDVCLGTTGQFEGMQFTKDGSLSFLPVKDGKLSHVIMTPDAIAAIPKPAGGAGAPATSAPPGYSKIYTFGSIPKDGATPAVLTAAPDGTLYGATSGGGKYQMGVLFKCDADGGNYKILHNWAGTVDGGYPSSIRVGPDGAVYGSLQVNNAIYRCSADGSGFKVLRAFKGDDGDSPIIMTIDPDGTICGISGPMNAPLHIFRMSPDGSNLKLIFSAARSTGGDKNPIGRFTDGGDGYYYGAAGQTLFKLKKDGTDYSVLRKFEGAPTDAARADYAPILASDGKLYGIDNGGGQARGGTIFTLARDGSGYKLLVDPDTDQLLPTALVEGTDGKLYAFVRAGLVRYNKDGSGYEVLQPNPDGGYRWTAFVHGGAFYGIADQGPNRGVIFRYGMGGGGATVAPTAVVQNVPPTPLDANVDLPSADSATPATPATPAPPAPKPAPAPPAANSTPPNNNNSNGNHPNQQPPPKNTDPVDQAAQKAGNALGGFLHQHGH
jgi:uncharacterized repeat protein (TIGR03803 family)